MGDMTNAHIMLAREEATCEKYVDGRIILKWIVNG
jgi:hypothetical protein